MVKGKLTKGRRKIEIKPIRSEEARHVCFSKRRPSLFKMASELSTLCGAEVAVVIFSPGGKSFSFGNPSTCSVVDRFFAVSTPHGHTIGSGSHDGTSHGLTGKSHEMNQNLVELQQSMEAEKQRKDRAVEAMQQESGEPVMQRLNADVGKLGLDELEELRKELAVVQIMVRENFSRMMQDASQTTRLAPQSLIQMVQPSQVWLGAQGGRPIYDTLPSSSNGPHEDLHVNSVLHGRSLGGFGNYFNGHFGG